MFKSRVAQGTIEYLVIIGVVVVISLVVVSLTTDIFGSNVDSTTIANAKLAWLSKDISVIEGVAGTNGTAIFVLQNNVNEIITVNSLEIDGGSPILLEAGTGKIMNFSDKYSANVTGVSPCTGQTKKYLIKINYTTSKGLNKSVPAGDFYANCYGNLPFLLLNQSSMSEGALPISDGIGGFNPSGTSITGLLILNNTLCFGGTDCDANISVEDDDLVFNN